LLLDETHELGVQLLGLEEEHVVVDDGSTRVGKGCIEISEGWRCQRKKGFILLGLVITAGGGGAIIAARRRRWW